MEDLIYSWYEEYPVFMEIDNIKLPSIIPKILDKEYKLRPTLAYVKEDEILLPTVSIYIQPSLLKHNIVFKKSVLFHEFTHILDANTICKSMDKSDMNAVMSTYSEYNAAKIQLAINAGLNRISEPKQVDIFNTLIYNGNRKKISILEDFASTFEIALEVIKQNPRKYYSLTPSAYFQTYKKFEICTMYYLGKRDFCVEHTLLNLNEKIAELYDEFIPFTYRIYQDILSQNFTSLPNSRNELWNKYKCCFSYPNKDTLPLNI